VKIRTKFRVPLKPLQEQAIYIPHIRKWAYVVGGAVIEFYPRREYILRRIYGPTPKFFYTN
jgi:hypothetical protein